MGVAVGRYYASARRARPEDIARLLAFVEELC